MARYKTKWTLEIVLFFISATSCRSKVVNYFRPTFTTVTEAENFHGVSYDENTCKSINDSGVCDVENISITDDCIETIVHNSIKRLDDKQIATIFNKIIQQKSVIEKTDILKTVISEEDLSALCAIASVDTHCTLVKKNFETLPQHNKLDVLDSLFSTVCKEKDVRNPPTRFNTMSLNAMIMLQKKEKPNVLNDFAKCLGVCRPDSVEPLMPVDRMPFGLIQHQMQFFSSKNATKVIIFSMYF